VPPQIVILDAGGQYCHLEARRVRDLGVYAEVRPSEIPASEIAFAKGIVISGGPSSVYDPGSPTVDPEIFAHGQPVLGICYGQQLMAHLLGGQVIPGWNDGLPGVTVGSRVMLVIPPAYGYGKAGNSQAGIKGTDTLVFVIDILDAESPTA